MGETKMAVINPSTSISWLAIITGIAGLLGLIFISLFFTGRPIFGPLNDLFIGLTAILSSILSWVIFSGYRAGTQLPGIFWVVAASLGAVIVVTGSVLVISGITGWYLAGLYMAAGYALIGLWLLPLNLAAMRGHLWPQGLAIFGVACGVLMLFGVAAVPGILRGMDTTEFSFSAANMLWGIGTLGWLVLYPIWCILLGRVLVVR